MHLVHFYFENLHEDGDGALSFEREDEYRFVTS
jgi:hypothetical protein